MRRAALHICGGIGRSVVFTLPGGTDTGDHEDDQAHGDDDGEKDHRHAEYRPTRHDERENDGVQRRCNGAHREGGADRFEGTEKAGAIARVSGFAGNPYNNGLEIRNRYMHGNQQVNTNEEEHFENYLTLLRLFVLVALKVQDDFLLKELQNNE